MTLVQKTAPTKPCAADKRSLGSDLQRGAHVQPVAARDDDIADKADTTKEARVTIEHARKLTWECRAPHPAARQPAVPWCDGERNDDAIRSINASALQPHKLCTSERTCVLTLHCAGQDKPVYRAREPAHSTDPSARAPCTLWEEV